MQKLWVGRDTVKFLILFLLTMAVATLAGCGAGGSGTSAVSGVAASPTPATVTLLVSNQQMNSSSTASTTLTAIVLDSNGQTMSGQTVIFSKGTDTSAYFTNVSATTGANGTATATLNIGANMANRVISLSATAGTTVGTNTVTVAGTKITISGNTSLALSALSTLTITVKDSTGAAVPNVALAVSSGNNNPLVITTAGTTSGSGITNSFGQITATVTASNAGTGTDVLTVAGAGTSQTQILNINTASFAFTSVGGVPITTTPQILVNTATPVNIHWTSGGGAVVGSNVSFNSTRGGFAATSVATNGTGDATLNVTAASTGATILTASGPGGNPAATLNVVFYTSTASNMIAQASPSTVSVNTNGSSINQSVISVVVRDAANNLVQNAHITFSQIADNTGGSLGSGQAVTDINGYASVNYIAGTTSSAQNGVNISATVDSVNGTAITPINSTVLLTVASQALHVVLGTDNTVGTSGQLEYTKSYVARVTDSAGHNAPDGTVVTFVLRPTSTGNAFYKGYFVWASTQWVQTITAGCPNEDLLFNGNISTNPLNGSLDTNGNGNLDPSGVAGVTGQSTTVNGSAIATINYPKNYAYWVTDDLEASAGTVGNNPPAVVTITLPGAAADYTNQTVPPSNVNSPYGLGLGVNNVCTNTL